MTAMDIISSETTPTDTVAEEGDLSPSISVARTATPAPVRLSDAHTINSEKAGNRDFMARVVPWPGLDGPGYVNLHWKRPNVPGMPGGPFKTVEDFMQAAPRDAGTLDMYFCLSVQSQHGKLFRGKPTAARGHHFATLLKAIWLDIDGNKPTEPEKGYATKSEAFFAFENFIEDSGMPGPSAIVDSGNGYHVYWISDMPMTVAEWEPYSHGLWALVKKHGLKCDPITTDCARVLRVPGTFNHKSRPPNEVRLLSLGDLYDFKATFGAMAMAAPSVTAARPVVPFDLKNFAGWRPPACMSGLNPLDSLAAGLNVRDDRPLNPDEVFKHCPHFQDATLTHGAGYGQGLWMLDVLACTFLDDGRRWAHYMSKGHKTYGDGSDTDTMYDRKVKDRADRGIGWPGCTAFENEGCKLCATCVFKGTIKSPLNLTLPTPGLDSSRDNEGNTGPDAERVHHVGALSYRMMSDITQTEIDWLWPERIASGKLTLIAGAPDDGKSQIVVNIAATISNGGEWPFEEGKAEQGAVIWLAAEDTSADITVPRLIAAGANRNFIADLNSMALVNGGQQRTLNIVDDIDHIRQVILAVERQCGVPVRLLVIDPISAYMGGRNKGDTWKNSDVRNITTPLLKLIEDTRIAVVGITHFNKSNNANVLNRVIDSMALPAISRATLLTAIDRDDGGHLIPDRRLLLKGKKNIGRSVPGLVYKINERLIDNGKGGTMGAPYVEWIGRVDKTADEALGEQTGNKAGKLEAAEDFLQRILVDGPLLEKEIRKKAGERHRWSTVKRAKLKLGIKSERTGGVAAGGQWSWSLPEIEPAEQTVNDTGEPSEADVELQYRIAGLDAASGEVAGDDGQGMPADGDGKPASKTPLSEVVQRAVQRSKDDLDLVRSKT
jgi:hypothetical protein